MESILDNQQQDRWYLGYSVVAGFLLVSIYYALDVMFALEEQSAFLITFAFYAVLFDVRHFFPTYARTLFDKQFMKENKSWFLLSWFLILALPLVAFIILSQGEFYSYNSFIVLSFILRLTYVFGFYHLIKQNWGFMAIYKKKHNEPEDGSDRWEKLLLLSGSFIPFVYLSKVAPVWFGGDNYAFTPGPNELQYAIDLWMKIGNVCFIFGIFFLLVGFVFKSAPQFKYVSKNIGIFLAFVFILIRWILNSGADKALNGVLILLALIFIVSLVLVVKRTIDKKIKNPEKWMVLISTLVLYNGILILPIENKIILAMAITIPHNIQYLAFTKVFSKRFYLNSKNDHGFAAVLAQKTLVFFSISVIYALLFETSRTGIKFIPSTSESFDYYRNMFSLFFIGMVLHHYYLDAVIWRVRKDKELSDQV